MEFERGIYRVIERTLKAGPNRHSKTVITGCQAFLFGLTVWNIMNLYMYHSLVVDQNSALKQGMED